MFDVHIIRIGRMNETFGIASLIGLPVRAVYA